MHFIMVERWGQLEKKKKKKNATRNRMKCNEFINYVEKNKQKQNKRKASPTCHETNCNH